LDVKKDEQFESRQYFIQTMEDVTYVMKTEGTIFIFEWMFVLYGSFKIREHSERTLFQIKSFFSKLR
jgi:hypothetical protein